MLVAGMLVAGMLVVGVGSITPTPLKWRRFRRVKLESATTSDSILGSSIVCVYIVIGCHFLLKMRDVEGLLIKVLHKLLIGPQKVQHWL